MKFKDWDLVDSKKFPQLAVEKLMKQKWLHGVEKARLLHLCWIPHYHRALITIFVIKQLLCLVHDGYLCLEEPIPITANLIHQISRLPVKGHDPMAIAGKISDLALTKAMEAKYKLERRSRGMQ